MKKMLLKLHCHCARTVSVMALAWGLLSAGTACAQPVSGTWVGGTDNTWLEQTNWTNGAVPNDIATFTNNPAPVSVQIRSATSLNQVLFDFTAPAYTIHIPGGDFSSLILNGAGIVNNSGLTQTFSIEGPTSSMVFNPSYSPFYSAHTNYRAALGVGTPSPLLV